MAVGKGSLDRVAKAAGASPKDEVTATKIEVAEVPKAAPKSPAVKAEKVAKKVPANAVYRVGEELPVHLL